MYCREVGIAVDIPHRNYDLGFKEAMTLFKDKALDFFGIDDIDTITESLATESVAVEIKSQFRDLVFATNNGKGLHLEEEVALNEKDLWRFLDYNVSLYRIHNRIFDTVIFVKEPTTLTGIDLERLVFKPIIVQCADIDADAMLDELKQDIENGKPINELKLVYLPLFCGKTLDSTGLFLESTKLIRSMKVEELFRHKVLALAILVAGKVVDPEVLKQIYEEVKLMGTGNVILDVAEEYGAKREKEEIARKLLSMGMDAIDVVEATGLSNERIRELRDTIRSESVYA